MIQGFEKVYVAFSLWEAGMAMSIIAIRAFF